MIDWYSCAIDRSASKFIKTRVENVSLRGYWKIDYSGTFSKKGMRETRKGERDVVRLAVAFIDLID